MGIAITGGRLLDAAMQLDSQQDLYIEGDKIVAIGVPPNGFDCQQSIAADGCLVTPGLIDLSAHLHEPGIENRGTVTDETLAAAAGGVTTLCCPPDANPIIDTPAVAQQIIRLVNETGNVRVLPIGALTMGLEGRRLSEMQALGETGCAALSNGKHAITDTLVLKRAMEYASTLNMTLIIHSEDPWLAANGCVHEGALSTRMGLPGIPEIAEVIALSRDLMLIEQTGVRAHYSQLSCARSVEMIADAKRRGLPVTADVAVHHLHLSDMDIIGFNSMCHVRPPLRSQRDREALLAGVIDGTIDAICSDHQPRGIDAKLAPFEETEPGISGIETLLPLALRLTEGGQITTGELLARLTTNPARILGIEAASLTPGSQADITIVNPDLHWTVTEQSLVSRGKNTPYLGWEMSGRVTTTLLGGEIVFRLNDDQRDDA